MMTRIKECNLSLLLSIKIKIGERAAIQHGQPQGQHFQTAYPMKPMSRIAHRLKFPTLHSGSKLGETDRDRQAREIS